MYITQGEETDHPFDPRRQASIAGIGTKELEQGKGYYNAVFGENNCKLAFDFIRRSAQLGNTEAQYRLGDLYALGQGINQSYTDAYEWYTKAAIQGYRKALIRIHKLYCDDVMIHRGGQSEDDDNSKSSSAIEYYTTQFRKYKQSTSKDRSIQENLAFQYQHGYGVKKYIPWAIELYTSVAEQGNAQSQFNLGQLYENNSDIRFNFKKAVQWYTMAAEQGNHLAQNKLGQLYERGLGADIDYANALYWYTEAASQGDVDAQNNLGKLYRKGGNNIDQCYASAIKWYTMAAQQGSSIAQNCLELLNQKGINEEKTPLNLPLSKKKRLCSKLRSDISLLQDPLFAEEQKKLAFRALVGDGESMYQIGYNYYHGIHFNQDKDLGFQWLIRAAKTTNEKACKLVAKLYKEGNIIEQNYFKASILYAKSAKQKDKDAQYDLGLLYKKGYGVRKDPLEASRWFKMATDQGHATAPYQLGVLRFETNGRDHKNQDTKEAFAVSAHRGHIDAYYKLGFLIMHCKGEPAKFLHLFEHSARFGSTRAQYLLGVLYERGEYVQQDFARAKRYYTMAAKSTHPKFQFKMALRYLTGRVVEQDYRIAFDLFKKAAKNGVVNANRLFATPIITTTKSASFYALVVTMFETVSGQRDLELNLGYIYEFGINNNTHCLFEKNWKKAIEWYNKGVLKGVPRAFFRLGIMYEEGKGTEKHMTNSLRYYIRAHSQGVTDATYKLACIYLEGRRIPQNYINAFNLFTEASNKGHEKSRMHLLPTDDKSHDTISMLKVVANSGNVALQYRLGTYYEESDMSEAIEWYLMAARAGMLDACYKLGHIYGQEQNYLQAFDLLQIAAKGNHDDALYELGKMYLYGRGVERDYEKAYEFYKMAAKEGNSLAYGMLDPVSNEKRLNDSLLMFQFVAHNGNNELQYKLGVYYENNNELGYSEAFKWYTMAANDLHKEALYRLGMIYEKGLGMEPNYQKSFQLYYQAANQGNSDAIYKLAALYHDGNGVEKDPRLAIKYFQNAAKKNDSTSQYMLGAFYEHGNVVQKNILKALKWYTKAYLQGDDHSASKLYNMYSDVNYESKFYLKLFRILSIFEKNAKTSDPGLYPYYGYMYYSLGTLYYYGRGPRKDLSAAIKYFSIACNKYGFEDQANFVTLDYNPNDPEGEGNLLGKLDVFYRLRCDIDRSLQYKLGMLYYHGLSTDSFIENLADSNKINKTTIMIPKNYLKAFIFFALSAENKRSESLVKIADMYLNGQGVTRNEKFALLLYKFAAEQLEEYVNYEFGMKFYHGDGAIQNYQVAVIFLKKSAEKNYTKAQRHLGDMYYYGDGVEINYDEALKWYKISINDTEQDTDGNDDSKEFNLNNNNPIAATRYYEKGMKYYNGNGTNKDYKISAIYFRKAAERGYHDAQTKLGTIYLQGQGVKMDLDEAMKWFKASTEEMDPEEAYEQGTKFYKDTNIEYNNYKISFLHYLKAAEMGHPKSQFSIGYSYFQGHGVDQDEDKALGWFERYATGLNGLECYDHGMHFFVGDRYGKSPRIAILFFKRGSDQGNANAQAQLGDIYLRGLGTEPNYDEAVKLYDLSSNEKSDRYCYERGEKFYIGNGVKQSHEISFLYMKKAAEKGHHEAKFKVGEMYIRGDGTERNDTEANKWLSQYIEKMDAYSCYEKGLVYSKGDDEVDRNLDISYIYLKAAAEKGHTKSYTKLGDMYLQGYGVEENYTKALKYYELYTDNMDEEELYEFGDRYYHADGEIFNQKVALAYFQRASERNHGIAQARLAEMYLLGVEVEQNRKKAFELIDLSTKSIDKYDLHSIGERYYYGAGVDINYEIAAIYFKTSADQGNDQAEAKLGDMYFYGLGVEQDHDEAIEWHTRSLEGISASDSYSLSKRYTEEGDTQCYQIAFVYIKLAAEGRYPVAQDELGDMYWHGKGVEQNYEKALEWYTHAARTHPSMYALKLAEISHCTTLGLHNFTKAFQWYQKVKGSNKSFALRGMGLMYEYGDGADQDYEKALAFYKDSANARNNGACYNIGLMYYYGKGVEQDYQKAFEWFTQAVKSKPNSDTTHIYVRVNSHKGREYVLGKEDFSYGKAHYFLGLMYENGYGVPKESDQAKKHLEISDEYCIE